MLHMCVRVCEWISVQSKNKAKFSNPNLRSSVTVHAQVEVTILNLCFVCLVFMAVIVIVVWVEVAIREIAGITVAR